MLKVSVRKVNGDLDEFNESDLIIKKLFELRRKNYSGKQLVHELLTDDWGVPPVGVWIRGKLENGTCIDEYIPYK